MALSRAEIRIHAHVCADGCLYKSRSRRSHKDLLKHPRKNIWRNIFHVVYVNNEACLLDQFSQDVFEAYGRKPVKSRKNEIEVQAKWILDRLSYLGAGKSHEWFISEEIMCSKKGLIIEWLRAFFDDEAYVDKFCNNITLNVVNKQGLKQIQNLFNRLGIHETSLTGPYFYKKYYTYRLKVLKSGLVKFHKIIGFTHNKKKTALETLITKIRW